MGTFNLKEDGQQVIDLGTSKAIQIRNTGHGRVELYIDHCPSGHWTSAIKANSGKPSPLRIPAGESITVLKSELESEHVRVGVHGDDACVQVNY
jgi:hypothetical protein